jgi:prepilin-type N-terminal cleavage/methylation domain-containing protein
MNVSSGKRLGFTLIELMIVVAIIGILASIAIPKFADLVRKSNEGSTKGSLGTFRSCLSIYLSDMEGTYPSDINSLTLNGKYLTAIPWIRIPPYHTDTNWANNVAATFDTINHDAISFMVVEVEPDTNWMFDTPAYGTAGVLDTGNIGNIWIDCWHTDTKGSFWTNY